MLNLFPDNSPLYRLEFHNQLGRRRMLVIFLCLFGPLLNIARCAYLLSWPRFRENLDLWFSVSSSSRVEGIGTHAFFPFEEVALQLSPGRTLPMHWLDAEWFSIFQLLVFIITTCIPIAMAAEAWKFFQPSTWRQELQMTFVTPRQIILARTLPWVWVAAIMLAVYMLAEIVQTALVVTFTQPHSFLWWSRLPYGTTGGWFQIVRESAGVEGQKLVLAFGYLGWIVAVMGISIRQVLKGRPASISFIFSVLIGLAALMLVHSVQIAQHRFQLWHNNLIYWRVYLNPRAFNMILFWPLCYFVWRGIPRLWMKNE